MKNLAGDEIQTHDLPTSSFSSHWPCEQPLGSDILLSHTVGPQLEECAMRDLVVAAIATVLVASKRNQSPCIQWSSHLQISDDTNSPYFSSKFK